MRAFSGYNNCDHNKYGINKIIDKIYFGSDELDVLDYIVVFSDNTTFNATQINEAIIYCSIEHYEKWNADSMRDRFPKYTKFVFPLIEE